MPYAIVAIFLAVGGAIAWLARPLAPDPKRRDALSEAVGAVDRELAANLELMTMFDQTKQAVMLENSQFARHGSTLAELPAGPATAVADLYARIPATESAMERRGPANTIRDEDRRMIEAWEGDARVAQRSLREALAAPPVIGWKAAIARLHGGSVPR